ncbi:MAG: DNA-directed RNA polymerase subunit alpha [candidate division TM6 bacterium GW2011_GWF2_32_72]|nr:MAG: DNA-directed RNA polymerase subunit alpha [candidate division TM6 bacterium GW2011_GWF2_32_72]
MDNKREYRPLIIPKLSWNKKNITETYGELVAQPLESGFGVTFGNAIRRILLGGIEGSAVTSIVVSGINNEFSSIEGVVEDATQLILNIKSIVVKSKDGKPGKMTLSVEGESVVKVSDIKADENLELINLDDVIAHVSPGGKLEVEFFVEPGRGYQAAKWPVDKPLQEDGRIYLDAMFSPVRRVSFDVEKTRVGKEIDYDKLILIIETNGSENPLDVLYYAVSVLRTQLEHFLASAEIPFNEISKSPEEEEEDTPLDAEEFGLKGVPVDLLLKPIDELELSVRAHNCLINAGIKRIIDLVNLSDEDSLKIKNFGRKSLNEVKDSMKAFGLAFGMDIKEENVQKLLEDRERRRLANEKKRS